MRSPFAQTPLAIFIASTLSVGSMNATADELVIEEVVVTAQKRAQSVQDVPIAIDAFSDNMVKERGIDNASDLAVQTPSLQYGEAVGSAQLSIRGVGFGLVSGAGENSVAVHRDGVYIANPGAVAMLTSGASSIEVLKGPQGTLWGRNATAGVVNFISPTPDDQLSGSLRTGLGNYNKKEVAGHINIPINDHILSRFDIESSRRDGYLDNVTLDEDMLGDERTTIRAAFDIDINDELSSQIRLFHAKSEMDGPVYDLIESPALKRLASSGLVKPGHYETDPYKTAVNTDTHQDDRLKGSSVRFDYDINDNLSLTSITGYIDFDRTAKNLDHDGSSGSFFTLQRQLEDTSFTQEFNLSGSSEDMEWLLGAYYMKQDVAVDTDPAELAGSSQLAVLMADKAGQEVSPGRYFMPNKLSLLSDEDIESYALFVDSTYHINEDWRVFGGLRWMKEERNHTFTDIYTGNLWTANPSGPGFVNTGTLIENLPGECQNKKSRQNENATTGRLGLQWDFNDSAMFYTQVSNGFKSGGHSSSACGDDFAPEKLIAFEAGIKADLWDGRARINGAVFAYNYEDLQVEEVINASVVVNNANAEIRGAEMDALIYITENFEMNFGLTLLDTRYTKFSNIDRINDPAFAQQDLKGNPLLRSPDWAGTIGAQYTTYLDNGGSIVWRADASLSDSYQLREFDHKNDEQDGYTLLNAFVTYYSPDETWVVTAWGKNLTGEEIKTSLLDGNSFSAPGIQGWASASWNEPTTFGVSMEYNF